MGGESCGKELAPYPDDNDSDDWDFADMLVEFHVDVRASFAETSMPFASFADNLTLQYLRKLAASLAWCCRSRRFHEERFGGG